MALPPPTRLESVILESGASRAYVAPDRGGMATRLFVGDRPIFYLDESTLLDTTKNVRGGNPVLFPSPGKLAGERFYREGLTGAMGQHGFARTLPWSILGGVGGTTPNETESVTLRLASDDRTRAQYPYDFVLVLRYLLAPGVLRIEQHVETTSATGLPFAIGFHPYFAVADVDKAKTRVPTRATRAWDNFGKRVVDLQGPIDLTAKEVDLHLYDHQSSEARLELADGHRITLRGSPELDTWVVWTVAGKDYVCLEPWSAPANALNDGKRLLRATRERSVDTWLEIAFT